MTSANNTLPERVGILESNFKTLHNDLQSTRTEVHSVRNLVEEKSDDLLKAIEEKTSPNKGLWLQFAALLVSIVVAGGVLNYFIINARVSQTDANLNSAVNIANISSNYTKQIADLREEWRREREGLILSETKTAAEAVHNDILGQIKGIRGHINKMQDDLDAHIKLPGHPVGEAQLKSIEGEIDELREKR